MSREQHLANAQVDVNRAVFAMNAQRDGELRDQVACSDDDILGYIKNAIMSLEEAKTLYDSQLQLVLR